MRNHRGFSMVELVVSMAILLMVVAMSSSTFITAANISRDGEQRIGEADNARIAVNDIVNSLRLAGAGMANGVYVDQGGSVKLVGTVFGVDGTTGAGGTGTVSPDTDDLWVIIPDRNALRESCTLASSTTKDPGAAVAINTDWQPTTALPVACKISNYSAGDLLVVSNLNAGALITGASFNGTAPNMNVTFNEQSDTATFSNAPGKGGFHKGDLVSKVTLRHYFVRNDPKGHPGLYKSDGALTGTAGSGYPNGPYPMLGRPFFEADTGELLADNVEDLQIRFALADSTLQNDPTKFTWQRGLGAVDPSSSLNPPPSTTLRAVEVSVVVRSIHRKLATNGTVISTADTAPITCDNHVPTPTPDGLMRMMYTRRITLPNQSTGSL